MNKVKNLLRNKQEIPQDMQNIIIKTLNTARHRYKNE